MMLLKYMVLLLQAISKESPISLRNGTPKKLEKNTAACADLLPPMSRFHKVNGHHGPLRARRSCLPNNISWGLSLLSPPKQHTAREEDRSRYEKVSFIKMDISKIYKL